MNDRKNLTFFEFFPRLSLSKKLVIYFPLNMIFLLSIPLFSFSQSFSPVVIASDGYYSENSSVKVSATIGETICETFSPTGMTSICGFQQGYPSVKILSVKVLPEGLFDGVSGLNKTQNLSGDQWPGDVADTIQIRLMGSSSPYTTFMVMHPLELNDDGTIEEINIPGSVSGSYYIAVFHRNSLETWSAQPLSFVQDEVSYDFTDDDSKAYGDNLKDDNGTYLIFAGDITSDGIYYPDSPVQDGMINGEDNYYVHEAYYDGELGYVTSDLNGDGMVDSNDEILVYDNYLLGIVKITP